jgi:hypothetical protein
MNYLHFTISIISIIAAYFLCLWGFRVLFLLAIVKIAIAIKEKALEGLKSKMGGFMDADSAENPNL